VTVKLVSAHDIDVLARDGALSIRTTTLSVDFANVFARRKWSVSRSSEIRWQKSSGTPRETQWAWKLL
jgi:hypothetical protein